VASAPTIICVLCPAGAKRGVLRQRCGVLRVLVDRSAQPPIAPRIAGASFSGASARGSASVGSSTLIDSRSA
jgi:hypothetical protein